MIDLDVHDGVHMLSMRDGENRINRTWLEDVEDALDRVEADADARALVTTGEGKFYSNGLDLDWLRQPETEPMAGFVADCERLFGRLLAFPLITVAACNGHAFAGGALLALCHDFRVMRADRGYFCLPEVDIKIPFTPGMDALIGGKLPRVVAREAMLTGRRYGGSEAASFQIVDSAVAESEVLGEAVQMAAAHGGKDRRILGIIKGRMYAGVVEHLSNSSGTAPMPGESI